MDNYIDKPTDIREGETIDGKIVLDYLIQHVPDIKGPIEIKQFPSGFSNLTYFIKAGDREMVLRRPPFGKKAKTAHDMHREYSILKALKPVFPYCPTPLVYCDDESVIGAKFYVMERIKGIILRKELPPGLSYTPEEFRYLCEQLLDIQCQLHSLNYKEIGLENFGKPEGYIERQVNGWIARYKDALTPDAPLYTEVIHWLQEKMPKTPTRAAVIHNDYKFDNVVLDINDPKRIIGVLDWEMATIGDPVMDLGNSLAYWVEKNDPEEVHLIRLMPTHLDGALTRKELVDRYQEKSGIDMSDFDYFFCFGLFRLAVIAQQIYYRFYHGQTKDKRFAMLIVAVQVLERQARKVIDKSKL
ncbi:MAG: phosphotransferase family protein [Spirochaetota bacterium]|nr:phosphotransferase family protein [Spirochaetota bacterium]